MFMAKELADTGSACYKLHRVRALPHTPDSTPMAAITDPRLPIYYNSYNTNGSL